MRQFKYLQVAVRLITDFSDYPRDHVPLAIQKHVQAAKINRENQGGVVYTNTIIIPSYKHTHIYKYLFYCTYIFIIHINKGKLVCVYIWHII